MAEATAYVRTQVRATNPAKGVYRTLDGSFEIRANAEKKGHWDVFLVAGGTERQLSTEPVKGYDAALNSVIGVEGKSLETLNTRPAKPKAEKKDEGAKPESEPTERRSGATGEAPSGNPAAKGRPSVKRGARKVA